MGTDHIIALLVMLPLLGLVCCGAVLLFQYRVKKSLAGRKLVTILTPSGERYDKLLKVDGDQLWDKSEGKNIPYMVKPEKSFDVWWPFGRPKIVQVSVKSYLYAERNPEPIDPFGKPPVITGEVLANLQDINFSKAMVGRSEELVEGSQARANIPVMLYVLIGIAILVSLVSIVMLFQMMGPEVVEAIP